MFYSKGIRMPGASRSGGIWPFTAIAAMAVSLAAGKAMAQSPPDAYLMFEGYYPTFVNDGNLSNPDEWVFPVTGTPNNAVPGGGDDAIVENTGAGLTNVPNDTVTGSLNCWGAGFSTTTVPLYINASVSTGAGGLGFSGDPYGPSATYLQTAATTSGPVATEAAVNIDAALTAGAYMYVSGYTQVFSTSVSSNGLLVVGASELDLNSSTLTTGQVGTLPPSTAADFYSTTTALQVEASTVNINGGTLTCSGDAVIGTVAAQPGFPDIGVVSVNSGGTWSTAGVTRLGVINPNGSSGPPLQGQAGTGDVFVNGSGSVWQAQQDVLVGADNGGDGFIYLQNGGELQLAAGANLRLGSSAGGFGVINFDGTGASPILLSSSSSTIFVGDQSYGTLNVQNGAAITQAGPLIAGKMAGSTGTISISGANSSLSSDGFVTIGNNGTATATIQNSGIFNASQVLNIGSSSIGTVTVQGGGMLQVFGNSIDLGQMATGTGNLTFDGTGGSPILTFTSQGQMIVGDLGTGNLTVQNGANISQSAAVILGNQGLSAGTALVTGQSSSWTVNGDFTVGLAGMGTVLVQNGGFLQVNDGDVDLGKQQGAIGLMTIDGMGTSFETTGTVTVGDGGTGTLNVQNGAAIPHAGALVLGAQTSGFGTLLVTGMGTTATFTSAVIGQMGAGTATVTAGATLATDGDMTLGENANGTIIGGAPNNAGVLTVSAQNTMLNVGGDLNVGGSDAMPGVGQATFTTTSQTMIGGDLNVGNTGSGNVMVQSGATIDVSGDVSVASDANSTGTLALTDNDTSLTCNSLTVGDGGMGTMTIAQGASVTTSSDATVGDQSGSKGTLTLTAASLSVGGDFTVGGTSSGNVTVQDGSSVTVTHDLVLGDQTGGNGKLFLDDTSTLDVGHQITIGSNGTGSLTAQLGAEFTAPTIDLGEALGGSGTLTVTGAGSSVTVTNELTDGDLGAGNISLSQGGELVDNKAVTLGNAASGAVGNATVGTGGLWIDDNDFTAAQSGQSTVTVSGGGQIQVGGETAISAAPGSIGAITVTGTDGGSNASTLYYSRALVVGQQGHANLFIKLGGQVLISPGTTADNGDVQVGSESGSNGTITISGAGSTLMATNISVGGTATAAGGTGTLIVGSGGTVQVANKIQMWKKGKVDVTGGGSVMVGSGASAPSGDVQIGVGGTLGGGGTIAGNLLNIGGTIAPGDPAMLSVTGDYTQDGGLLQLDIAGTDPSDFDQLDVSGELSLQSGSILQLNFIDGFAPMAGDTFDLIDYATLDPENSAFATVEIEGLEPGFDYTLAPSGGDSFALTALNNAVAVPEPGACMLLALGAGVFVCRFRGRWRPGSSA